MYLHKIFYSKTTDTSNLSAIFSYEIILRYLIITKIIFYSFNKPCHFLFRISNRRQSPIEFFQRPITRNPLSESPGLLHATRNTQETRARPCALTRPRLFNIFDYEDENDDEDDCNIPQPEPRNSHSGTRTPELAPRNPEHASRNP
jgi:hypothetical protein